MILKLITLERVSNKFIHGAAFQIENNANNHLLCTVNQTSFYLKRKTGLKWSRRYVGNGRLPVQTSLGAWFDLEHQPLY